MNNKKIKTIGITGGMGSGKSTVLKFFEKWGAEIYIADEKAKCLMQNNSELTKKIKKLIGEKAYEKKMLNKKYIANKIFNNRDLLKKMQAIVHKEVRLDFQKFKKHLKTNIVIYETALLFENKSNLFCDKTILVIAPKNLRVERIMIRDGLKKEAILKRMQHQLSDKEKILKADFLIKNNSDRKSLERESRKTYDKFVKGFLRT